MVRAKITHGICVFYPLISVGYQKCIPDAMVTVCLESAFVTLRVLTPVKQ